MKHMIIFALLVLSLSSCGPTQNAAPSPDHSSKFSSGSEVVQSYEFEAPLQEGAVSDPDKELTLKSLLSRSSVTASLHIDNNGDYIEELPRIESYGTPDAFYEYYFFLARQQNDVTVCDNIADEANQSLCQQIFPYGESRDDFVAVFVDSGEDEVFAQRMFDIYTRMGETISCEGLSDILSYVACKKMQDSSTNVGDIFLNYYVLLYSTSADYNDNFSALSPKHFPEIMQDWGMPDDAPYPF